MSTLLIAIAVVALGHAGRRHLVEVRRDDSERPSSSAHAAETSDWATLLDAIAAGVRSGTSLRESYLDACRRMPPPGRVLGAGTELHRVPSLVSSDPDESVALQT
ncbi:MAG: hypothetical protein HY828_06105 [Actinobacteria bacterium]|nr:hypothetical protein [Actinomycetota bacterium]